jgi:hypothetical protein
MVMGLAAAEFWTVVIATKAQDVTHLATLLLIASPPRFMTVMLRLDIGRWPLIAKEFPVHVTELQ